MIIIANSKEELEQVLKENKYQISSLITKCLLKNLKNKKKNIKVLEVHSPQQGQMYDITISRDKILLSLEQNLKIHEEYEDFETCIELKKAIDYIQQKEKV